MSPDSDWLAAASRAEIRGGQVTVTHQGEQRSFYLFCLTGFPCSGMDWIGRLLSLHPAVAFPDGTNRLSPVGSGHKRSREEMQRAGEEKVLAALGAAWKKPGATHLGVVALSGDAEIPAREIVVLRDGRDVVVAWTIRQLREEGMALQRFLKKPEKDQYGMENLMPRIHRRFKADPADILDRNPGVLLSDYDWVRYSAQLWDEDVIGHFSTMGAIADGKCTGEPLPELRYDEARADPSAALSRLTGILGLDPIPDALRPTGPDPVGAVESDPELLAEWEVGRWKRYFTPRATKLFKMDAWSAMESVTGNYGDDEWEGECEPGSGP